jgi:hypothetical protein
MKLWQVCVLLACGVGCDDDVTECSSGTDSCAQGSDDAGGGGKGDARAQQSGDVLLGAGATSYTESSEATNGSAPAAELTGYTLEAASGIAIHGTFEATAPTADSYRFNAGALGKVGAPGFPGVDVRLVIDGDRTQRNTPLSLLLDTVAEKGYSSLSAGNYFSNAALIRGEDYVITVAAGAPGKSYTLELRGRTP